MKWACRCTYTCVRWSVHFQTFIQLWVTMSNLHMHEHTHIVCMSSWCTIMMIKTLHVRTHARVCLCVDRCLHISKGVQACRPACTHVCMCEHTHTHKAWWWGGYNRSLVKAVISAYFTMIDHDDQNPSCMHACQHFLMHGWLVTHKQRCTSMQTSIQTCICAWTHAGTCSLL